MDNASLATFIAEKLPEGHPERSAFGPTGFLGMISNCLASADEGSWKQQQVATGLMMDCLLPLRLGFELFESEDRWFCWFTDSPEAIKGEAVMHDNKCRYLAVRRALESVAAGKDVP